MSQPRPHSGPKKRWSDVAGKDLQQVKVREDEWPQHQEMIGLQSVGTLGAGMHACMSSD